jgi:hypothetical protein
MVKSPDVFRAAAKPLNFAWDGTQVSGKGFVP